MFESGGSRAQTPSVELKTINQTIDLKSDQTVILSGFQQFSRKSLRQGVGTPSFFGLGGGVDSADDDTILVVLNHTARNLTEVPLNGSMQKKNSSGFTDIG
ncbi:putative type IV pilus outer membrane secretin lipoprotein [Escherichia coli]|nr:putative type IV pilus outer membrane secretin lipoprotein [Escherichia coli]